MKKTLGLSILLGAILGIFCIIGIGYRVGFQNNELFLISAWYNRVIMGLVIGLVVSLKMTPGKKAISFIRGALLGLGVSFAWFLSTEFRDPMGFAAGILYGVIIDMTATYYSEKKSKSS